MLIRMTVENFKSFDKKVDLSLLSSSKIRKKPDHKVRIRQASFLKYAVVYGANASGKSNLTDVFAFIAHTVREGLPVESYRSFCRNRQENQTRPSTFELQFTVEDKFFAYGFSAVLAERKISEEWLYELHQNGGAKELFHRDAENAPELGEQVAITEAEKNRFLVYADDFAGHDSLLFLTEMNRNKKYEKGASLSFFRTVFLWIAQNIIVLNPNSAILDFEQYYDETSLKNINRMISTFDTGITKISPRALSLDELSHMIPEPILTQIIDNLKRQSKLSSSNVARISFRTPTNIVNIRIDQDGEEKISTLSLKHGDSIFDFSFEDESDGTRRIFDLIDMLLTKRSDLLFVVDEMERSLHSKLTEHFLELFNQAHKDQRIQLLFTTHEDSIMDLKLFRRDEIWFVEREADNASELYSLDRFKERYDKKLSKAYLAGRYGAIPVFQKFSFREDN